HSSSAVTPSESAIIASISFCACWRSHALRMGVSMDHGVPVTTSQRGAYAEVRQLSCRNLSVTVFQNVCATCVGKPSTTRGYKSPLPDARIKKSLNMVLNVAAPAANLAEEIGLAQITVFTW